MDHQAFHQTVLALKPSQPTKPSTLWVAVLNANIEPSQNAKEEDFLWVKCHGRIKVSTILAQYHLKHKEQGKVALKLGHRMAGEEIMMKDLTQYNDQLIVFEAVKIAEVFSRMSNIRSPLQPTNNQLTIKPDPGALHSESKGTNYDEPSESMALGRKKKSDDQKENLRLPSSVLSQKPYLSKPYRLPPQAKFSKYVPLFPGTTASTPLPSLTPPAMVTANSLPGIPPATTSTNSTAEAPTNSPLITGNPNLLTSAASNGFALYSAKLVPNLKLRRPPLSDEQIHSLILDRWLKLSSAERQSFEDSAKANAKNSNTEFEPIKSELNIKDILPIDESCSNNLESQKVQSFQLQTLLQDASPELLESSVKQGVRSLENLKGPLMCRIEDTPEAQQWMDQIDNLCKQAVKTRTVIGVVGNTGAGKSSVINAMLDEERLLPTSCMRACTAVVTEISYNDAEIPYRAQIEFIKSADWERELKTLFQDLIDSNGNVSRECSNPDTEAGVAYAKIKAVYPRKTKEDIANSSIGSMLREVSQVLGATRDIEESDSLRFYQRLQHYVDSKEKSTGDKEKDKKKERREMEFWPLIRVVRIYVKSPSLSTGAVIVDLPGVHDSNAARAAVADNYMKECTGLWIVAPINRAVDDKAAKTLLGESFKRQLKMDGGFSTVTFICSKTDDISLMEAQEALGLDEEMSESWLEMDGFAKKVEALEKEMNELKDTKATFGDILNDAEDQAETWEAIKDSFDDGKTVFAPMDKSARRKRKADCSSRARKRQRRAGESEAEETGDSNCEESSASEHGTEGFDTGDEDTREPLDEERIVAKINEIRTTKKEARNQRADITEKMVSIRKQIEEARASEKSIEAEISSLCISGRNQYSRGAIQQDFAAGMKEMDQEMQEEADEENFNPEVEFRDYEKVARELPVFCVSSRGYQKLQGRLRKDPNVPGFKSIEETEIPQLQAHCEKLTEKGRIANCKRFINNLSMLLNSLALWASNDGTGSNMTPAHRAREEKYLQKGLKELESGLEKASKTTCSELSEEVGDNIFDKYDSAIANAVHEASTVASSWGAPVNRDNRSAGGYCWSTYKAICRRNGVYSNAQGPHEWNVRLCEPMMKVLASGWEKTFSRRLPIVMISFTRNAASVLKNFHRDVDSRARTVGAGIAGLNMLQQQLGVYENILKDLANLIRENVNNIQKDINREFTPVIERAMTAAYTACVDESGPGSFARMKAAMNSIVDQERHVMFQDSANEARNRIKTMIRDQEEIMRGRTDEVFVAVRRDYRAVLSGGDTHGESLPKSQRLLRKDVMNILEGVETEFKQAIGIENDDKMVDKAVTLTDEMMGQLKSEKLEDIKNDGENAHPDMKQELQEEADFIKSADHGPKSCPDVKSSVEDSTESFILKGSEPSESTHNQPQHGGMDTKIEQEIKAEDSLDDHVNQGEEETEVWLPGGGSTSCSPIETSTHSDSEASVDL